MNSKGKINHFEISGDDMARASKFYSEAFGWEVEKYPMPDFDYYALKSVEKDDDNMPIEINCINGGMFKRTDPNETTYIVITVPNMAEALESVKNAGGKVILPSREVGNMGLYARIEDTEGNILGFWETLGEPESK